MDLRLARLTTDFFAPPPVAGALTLLIAWQSSATTMEALWWALVTIVFATLGPITIVLVAIRMRRIDDLYMRRREQRLLPLTLISLSVLVGLVVLSQLGAPAEIVALAWALVVGILATTLITLVWKISFHAAVAAGALAILWLTYGATVLATMPFLALVAWARVRLRAHTPAQVLAGVLFGAIVAAASFLLAGGIAA